MQADSARKRGTDMDIVSAAQGPAQAPYTDKQGQYLAFIYRSWDSSRGDPVRAARSSCCCRASNSRT
jgi:hypothetical protein